MCRIRTLRKIPPWFKFSDRKGKNSTMLALKECAKGLVIVTWIRPKM
jgi:hypothetical protein